MTETDAKEPDPATCAKCGAASSDAAFCEQCGAARTSAAAREKTRPSAERSRAAYELNRAKKLLAGVRGVFGFFAVVGLAMLALGLLALRAVEDDEDRSAALVLTILGGLQMLVGAIGCFRAAKEPLLWGITLAAMCTVAFVLQIVFDPAPLALVRGGVFALFAWLVVPNLAKARRLMREHADLRIAQQLQGTFEKRAVAPGEIQARVRARDARMRGQRLARVAVGVGIVGALGLCTWWLTRPRHESFAGVPVEARATKKAPPVPVEPAIATFEAAWNRNDKDAIAALYAASERERAWATTQRFLERRGWKEELPKLGKPELDRKAVDQVRASYEVQGHEFRVWWRGSDTGWTLGSFAYEK